MHAEIVTRWADGNLGLARLDTTDPVERSRASSPESAALFRACYSPIAGQGVDKIYLYPGGGAEPWIAEETAEAQWELVRRMLPTLPGPVLVHGGHYVPAMNSKRQIPPNALKSLTTALEIAACLVQAKKPFGLLTIVNDITCTAYERQAMAEEPELPAMMRRIILDWEQRQGVEIRTTLISETKLTERLHREKARLVRQGQLLRREDGSYVAAGDETEFALFTASGAAAPRCVRAFARLVPLPSELHYASFAQVMPRCGTVNAHKGYALGRLLYPEVPAILWYHTEKCW